MTQVNGVGSSHGPGHVPQGQVPKGPTPEQVAALFGLDPATAAALIESGGGVTPELIMGLLENRVGNIDQQIQDLMSKIDERTSRAKELQLKQGAVSDLQMALESLPTEDGKAVIPNDFKVNGVPLEKFLSDNGLSGQVTLTKEGGQTKISKDALGTLADKLGEQQRAANSGNELDMIRLQSAMQQRSQAITMASNMIKSIFDTLKAIVGNLR